MRVTYIAKNVYASALRFAFLFIMVSKLNIDLIQSTWHFAPSSIQEQETYLSCLIPLPPPSEVTCMLIHICWTLDLGLDTRSSHSLASWTPQVRIGRADHPLDWPL